MICPPEKMGICLSPHCRPTYSPRLRHFLRYRLGLLFGGLLGGGFLRVRLRLLLLQETAGREGDGGQANAVMPGDRLSDKFGKLHK